jgi:hypothetical protein
MKISWGALDVKNNVAEWGIIEFEGGRGWRSRPYGSIDATHNGLDLYVMMVLKHQQETINVLV